MPAVSADPKKPKLPAGTVRRCSSIAVVLRARTPRVLVHGMAIVLNAISSSTNALQAFQTSLDTSAGNLANESTNAFKSRRVLFQDLLNIGPPNAQIGQGAGVSTIDRDFTQGKTVLTDNDLDVAVQGHGFLSVLGPDGTIEYTRDGSLRLNNDRKLVNSDGLPVQPPLTFPDDVTSTKIAPDGTVTVLTSSSPDTPIIVGQLHLTKFNNPQGLRPSGGNRFVATDSSGLPLTSLPQTSGLGSIQQRSLEQSNVDTSAEIIRLVTASRSYVANSRALKVEDQFIEGALRLVG